MVNGADVELLREEDNNYIFKDSDSVSFISMIHGGWEWIYCKKYLNHASDIIYSCYSIIGSLLIYD